MNQTCIPKQWHEVSLGDINNYQSKSVQPKNFLDETFELWSVPNFPTDKPEILSGQEIGSSKQAVAPHDVLICKINPRINRVWEVREISEYRKIASSEWIVFRQPMVEPRFFRRFFQSSQFREKLCADVSGVGGSLTRAQPKKVAIFSVPVPPLAEQKIIADKLDTLLAQVDNTKARLERIPDILKRFRQSVLAAAVSGRLTKEWRNGARFSVEPGELSSFVSIDIGHAFKSKEFTDQGIPLLRGQNIEPGALRWSETKYFPESLLSDFHHLFIEAGDIVLAMDRPIISSGLKIARAKPSDLPCVLVQRVARFKSFDGLLPDYLYILLQDVSFNNYIQPNQTGSDIPHISGKQILAYPVNIPDVKEQTEIVRRVDQLFAHADRIEQQVNQALERVNNLTKSILAKAFRGELTEQWRKDNPELISGENSAYALLARIKKERMAQQVAKTKLKSTQYKVKTEITTMRLFEHAEITLSELLKELGGETDAHTLWKKSNLSIDDFYAKLKKEKIIVDDNESADPSLRKLKIKEQ